MRRNKVLTTLAAVSMSAMMAVSAAPAVNVMAANETTEVAQNVKDQQNPYTMSSTYLSRPVLKDSKGNDVSYTLSVANIDGAEVTEADLEKAPAGTKVTGVRVTVPGETETLQVPDFTIGKANPTVKVSQGNYDASKGGNYNPTVNSPAKYTTSLEKQNGSAWTEYDKDAPKSNGTYRVKVVTDGNDNNYNSVTTYSAPFEVTGISQNTDLTVTVNDSTFTENPTVTVPTYEDRTLTADITPVYTVQALNDKGVKTTTTREGNVISAEVKNGKLNITSGENDWVSTINFKEGGARKVLRAGTYKIVVHATDASGKVQTTQTQTVTVAKKAIGGVELNKSSYIYKDVAYYPISKDNVKVYYTATNNNGKAEKVYLGQDDVDKDFTITLSGAKKDSAGNYYVTEADDYTVTATAKADNNDLVKTINGNGEVTQNNSGTYFSNDFSGAVTTKATVTGNLPQAITWSGAFEKTYDGKAVDVKATGNTGAATLTYTDANGKELAGAPVNAGTYYVKAVAKADKNYGEATATKKIVINRRAVSIIENSLKTVTYDGGVQLPELYSGKAVDTNGTQTWDLTKDKDYTVVAAKNDDATSAGEHAAVVKLKGNFKGDDATVKYTIKPYILDSFKLTSLVSVDDAEPGKTPVVHVYAEDGKEIPAEDYKVSVSNNGKIGTGSVNISGRKNTKTGKENVTGSVTLSYNVAKAASVDKTDLYRLYNKNTGEHFFTTSAGEKNNLVKAGWNFEGVSMKTVENGGTPVYRLYNKNNGGEHHYTTSKGEANALVKKGWIYEGVAFNAANKGDKGAVKVYRVYNKNKKANNHHYTTSWGEKTLLVKAGWRDEGVAFYAYNAL